MCSICIYTDMYITISHELPLHSIFQVSLQRSEILLFAFYGWRNWVMGKWIDKPRLRAYWPQGLPVIMDLLTQHRSLQLSGILFIVYPSVSQKETTCQSCWQGILSLWGHNVFSSQYGKPWFILFGPQSYFAQHENKANYILESFANEILKPVSVIKLTAMLFSRIEGEGRSAVH